MKIVFTREEVEKMILATAESMTGAAFNTVKAPYSMLPSEVIVELVEKGDE